MGTRNYGLITSTDELAGRISAITGSVFSIDIETGFHGPDREKAAVHPETAFIVGISFTNSTNWARYVPLGHDDGENLDNTEVARLFWPLLNTGLGVAHNMGFELRHLAKWFRIHLSDDPVYGEAVRAANGYFPIRSDTQVEAHLMAEHRRFGLKFLTMVMFDRNGNLVDNSLYLGRSKQIAVINKIKDPAARKQELDLFDGHVMTELHDLFPDLPKTKEKFIRFNVLELTSQVIEYACEDSVWCLAIHQHYYPKVKDRLTFTFERAVVQNVLPSMADEGICYNWPFMGRKADELRIFRDKYNAEIMQDLTELTDEPVAINLASAPQVASILFDKLGYRTNVYTVTTRDLPSDQRKMSTGKIALERLAKQHPVVEKIRHWKKMTKLLGTYLDRYEPQFNYAEDGRAHPSLNGSFVVTGRFSCSDPNYQQCLPGSYQVLTPFGWQRLDQLQDNTPVAQYDKGQNIMFVIPEVIRSPYDGDMIEVGGSTRLGTWRYTPNHRIVYQQRQPRGARGPGPIKEVAAEQWEAGLVGRPQGAFGVKYHDRLVPCAGYTVHRPAGPVNLDSLLLAIAVQADGTHTNGHQYDIAVHKQRKVDKLRQLGLEPELQSRGRWRVRVPDSAVEPWLDENKNFIPIEILALDKDTLRIFIEEVMQWDGDFVRGARYGQNTTRRQSVDVVQAAAALIGRATCLYEMPGSDHVVVNLHPRAHRDSGHQVTKRVRSDGMVYCVTVPSGMFIARNDEGNVQVTGNSPKKYHYDLDEAAAAHAAGEQPPPGTCFQFNFRDMIVAPPDHYIFGFDLSQAELRAAAGEAQETALLEAFARGDDVHSVTASLMLGIPLSAVTPKERDIGKTLNFALLFGLSPSGLADRLAITRDEAQELMDKYFGGLPAIANYMQKMVRLGQEHGYVVSKFGRKLPIWEYNSDSRAIRSKGDRACVNYPIQGAATGDYMKIAMVRAVSALKKAGLADRVKLVMNIHDALEFYVHRSVEPHEVIAVLQPAVIFDVPGWPLMKADWHIGRKWGSPMEVLLQDDGRVLVKGEKVYELTPVLEEDEDGELVEVLPDVDLDTLRTYIGATGAA